MLSSDRLAEILVLAQPLPLTHEAAYELAGHWVALMAFGRRMAEGDSLLDSTGIAHLMAGRMRRIVIEHWRDHLLAKTGGSRQAFPFDSSYPARLLAAKHARLSPAATQLVRKIATNPWTPAAAEETLATFAGGALTIRELAQHVQYLTPATRSEMVEAADGRIEQFLWEMVLEELWWGQADSAKLGLSAREFQDLAREARATIHALWERTGLAPAALAAAAGSMPERRLAAARQVEAYLEAAAARKIPFEPVPAFVAVALLREVRWEIAPEGVEAALERARRLLAATASKVAGDHGETRLP
jgi:hypothetical protein